MGAFGLTWERHYQALAPESVAVNDLRGWWLSGYDDEGFARASVHVPDAHGADDAEIAEPLVEVILAALRAPT